MSATRTTASQGPSSLFFQHQYSCQAAEESVTSSASAEVWKIDPSDGSLYVVTRQLADPADRLGRADLKAEKSSSRQLKVEVTSAELLPAITGMVHHRRNMAVRFYPVCRRSACLHDHEIFGGFPEFGITCSGIPYRCTRGIGTTLVFERH